VHRNTVDVTSFLTRRDTFGLGLWRRLNVALETMIEARYVLLELLIVGSASCVSLYRGTNQLCPQSSRKTSLSLHLNL
jgi:hypothetical protein